MLRRMRSRAIALGLGAAALLGLSALLGKLGAGRIGTPPLGGLLYLGAGIALGAARLVNRSRRETPLRRGDGPVLGGVVAAGAGAGPVLLVVGLRRLPGSAAGLPPHPGAPPPRALSRVPFGGQLGP